MDWRRWGFQREPFSEVTLAAKPFVVSESFQHTYRDLLAATRAAAGLLIVIGERGSGRSTLLRYLLRGLPFAGIVVETFPPERIEPEGERPGARPAEPGRPDGRVGGEGPGNGSAGGDGSVNHAGAWKAVRKRLAARSFDPRPLVLAVDDGDALPADLLADMLSIRTADARHGRGPVTLLLAGTSVLVARLTVLGIRAEDVALCAELQPLLEIDVTAYVGQALTRAGGGRPGFFAPEAIRQLSRRSRGNLARINEICRTALAIADELEMDAVSADLIDEAADTCGIAPAPPPQAEPLRPPPADPGPAEPPLQTRPSLPPEPMRPALPAPSPAEEDAEPPVIPSPTDLPAAPVPAPIPALVIGAIAEPIEEESLPAAAHWHPAPATLPEGAAARAGDPPRPAPLEPGRPEPGGTIPRREPGGPWIDRPIVPQPAERLLLSPPGLPPQSRLSTYLAYALLALALVLALVAWNLAVG